jgi:hypothetical protein
MKKFLLLFFTVHIYSQPIEDCYATSTCGENILCSKHGMCFVNLTDYYLLNSAQKNSICVCNDGYTDDPNNNTVKCCYKMRSKLKAFVLEMFLDFGSFHFYLGNYYMGFIKFSCCISLCCLFCFSLFVYFFRQVKEKNKKVEVSTIIIFVSFSVFIAWKLVDLIMIGTNFIKDGNGIELTY